MAVEAPLYRRRCLAEKGGACSLCGSENRIEVHHINGDRTNNRIENLIPVCSNCHILIHGDTDELSEWTDLLLPIEDRPQTGGGRADQSATNYTETQQNGTKVTVEVEDVVRDELRSYKADRGLTYDEALVRLLRATDHEFRHLHPHGNEENDND